MSQFEVSLNGSAPRVDLHLGVERRKLAEKMGRKVVGPKGGGLKKTPEYHSWKAMWNRCTLKTHPAYHRYGGSGITVCDRWRQFPEFFEDMGNRPDGKTLDRIDTRKGYYPGNCRWADRLTQGRNTKAVIPVEVGGISFGSISEAAEYWGIKRKTLEKRIRHYRTPSQYWHLKELPKKGDRA